MGFTCCFCFPSLACASFFRKLVPRLESPGPFPISGCQDPMTKVLNLPFAAFNLFQPEPALQSRVWQQ